MSGDYEQFFESGDGKSGPPLQHHAGAAGPPPQGVPPVYPPIHQRQVPGPVSAGWANGDWLAGQHRAAPPMVASPGHGGGPLKPAPQRGWRRVVYMLTRVNLGLSPDELDELNLHARIRRNVQGCHRIAIVGLKGGTGKTTVTVTLGSALSAIRGDRILAVDADPDAGNLADRARRQSPATLSDLLARPEVASYHDIHSFTSMNSAYLEVLASPRYTTSRRTPSDEDWKAVTRLVSPYYNIVLADLGTGLSWPSARAVLSSVSGLVVIAGATADGAQQAAMTMEWLQHNGYRHLVPRACVVINSLTPGRPLIDIADLAAQFGRHVAPGRVVVLPWDAHIAEGTEIEFSRLSPAFRRRIVELAATLSDDFQVTGTAAGPRS